MSNRPNMTGTRPRVAVTDDDLIYGTVSSVGAAVAPAPVAAVPVAAVPVAPVVPVEPRSAPEVQPPSPEPTATQEPAASLPTRVIFTNQLAPEMYIRVRQYQFHTQIGLNEILHEALSAYLADKPESNEPMPPKVAAKWLKVLNR